MKPITREWVAKAEGDFTSARREVRVRRDPNYNLVCFLGQQCAEKYLKTRLVEAGADFPKIHNLTALLKLVAPIEPSLTKLHPQLAALNPYAVEFRYLGAAPVGRTRSPRLPTIARCARSFVAVTGWTSRRTDR